MVTAVNVQDTTTMQDNTGDDFNTPITALDCEMQELETVRYEDGIDLGDSRYL